MNDLIAKWQKILRLSDWRIVMSSLESDPDDRSTVNMDVRTKCAVIRLRSDTPTSQIERQIVHELIHVLLSGMEDTYRAAKDYTPKAWDDAGDRMWDRGAEFAVEALTDALTSTIRAEWGPVGSPWADAFPPKEAL